MFRTFPVSWYCKYCIHIHFLSIYYLLRFHFQNFQNILIKCSRTSPFYGSSYLLPSCFSKCFQSYSLKFYKQDLPGDPVVRTWAFHCQDSGLIPSGGTKILQTLRQKKKIIIIRKVLFCEAFRFSATCICSLCWVIKYISYYCLQ